MAKKSELTLLSESLRACKSESDFSAALFQFCRECETSKWYKFSAIAKLPDNQERIKNSLGNLASLDGITYYKREISFNKDTWEQTDSFKIIQI